MTEKIGYARVSTVDQDPDHQIQVLKSAGCQRIFTDYASGGRLSRPNLDLALATLRPNDTLVVWKFDRLGRSLKHLIDIVASLGERSIQLQSLTEQIDTNTAGGRMIFSVLGALAEFERALISERTKLAAAHRKEKNQRWGRPSPFHDPGKVAMAKTLLANQDLPRAEVARQLGVTPLVLYRWFPGGKPENFGKGRNGPGTDMVRKQ